MNLLKLRVLTDTLFLKFVLVNMRRSLNVLLLLNGSLILVLLVFHSLSLLLFIEFVPRWGATVCGARKLLVAFNINVLVGFFKTCIHCVGY